MKNTILTTKYKTFLITVLICLFPILGKGQFCKLYTTHGDISSSMINNIYQDQKGYIWVSTDDGLNKFDGVKFTSYRTHKSDSTSLLGNHVYKVFQDSKGCLYILSTKGLQVYEYQSDTFKTIKKSSPSFNNKSITELHNGNILIGTSGYGIKTLLTDSKGNYQIKDWNPSLSGYTINEIMEDKNGNIWICTEYHGIIRIDKNGKKYNYSLGTQNGNQFINCCTEDSYGNVYVGTTGRGVFVYQKGNDTFNQIFDSAFPIKDLKQKEQFMLIGIDGEGIVSYNIPQKRLTNTDFYIDNVNIRKSKVHSLLIDKSENLWVGIYQKGVAFIPLQANMFGYIGSFSSIRNYIGNNCITALCNYDDGKLIIGTDNDGIYQLTEHYNFIRHLTPESNPNIPSTVMCLFKDSNKNVWIGSYLSGLSFMHSKGDKFVKVSLKNKEGDDIKRVYCLAEDSHKRLWIGTMGMGLYFMDLQPSGAPSPSIKVYNTKELQDINQWIDALYYAKNGRLYIGTYDGIKCIDTQNLKVTGKTKSLLGLVVYSITEDQHHRIWAGTSDGIVVMDQDLNIIEQFTTQNGLPNNSVSSIVIDKNNDIWVSTNQGIAKYTPQKKSFIPFYASDGLYNNEFSRNAFCQYPDGRILFGGTNGIIFFNPDDIKTQKFQSKIRITGFYLHDKPVNELTKSGVYHILDNDIFNTKEINLAHDDNSFYIEFATDNFIAPQAFLYSINNGTWNSLPKGTSRVSFSNLPVGKYEFRIKAINGSAESEIKTVTIHIHPAWYNSTIAWIIYLVIIGSIAAIFIRQAKEKYKVRQEMLRHKHLEEINEAKLQFFINISHEIRTPMSLIISPLQKLISTDKDVERQKSYSLIERNAQRILNLINQLMDIRKIDKNQMKLSFTEVELISFISDIKDTFAYQAASKGAQIHIVTQLESLKVWLDPNNFDKVIFNLLSNALKHIQNDGKINIYINSIHNDQEAAPLNNCAEIIIEDNGTGIKESEMKRIFERFYQVSDDRSRSKGTGIGLHLSMSLVKMHHGTITVKNNDNQPGCSFTIHIPLGCAHLSPDEINQGIAEHSEEATNDLVLQHIPSAEDNGNNEENNKKTPRKKHSVLIVEDEDDIRNYLLTELGNHFRVLSCSNGKEALEIIMSHMPDLVLSDIMMPEINGITLLKKLKQNIKTNHIPVILLTAKNSEKDYIEGLSLGADAYIAKPFNLDILITTIENLIRNREVLRNNFSGKQEQDANIEVAQPQSADEKLMKKVMKAINKNLNNPELNAEMIAAEVGISRVHLYRKLKELTNQSTRDFIRNIRLKQAEILLKSEKNYSISEISQLVGFNNTTYFSNAFKELYGVSPSKYVEHCKEAKEEEEKEEKENQKD